MELTRFRGHLNVRYGGVLTLPPWVDGLALENRHTNCATNFERPLRRRRFEPATGGWARSRRMAFPIPAVPRLKQA